MLNNRNDKTTSCDGKIKYNTRTEASNTLPALNRGTKHKCHAYYCSHCEGYHVGHQAKRNKVPWRREKYVIDPEKVSRVKGSNFKWLLIRLANY